MLEVMGSILIFILGFIVGIVFSVLTIGFLIKNLLIELDKFFSFIEDE